MDPPPTFGMNRYIYTPLSTSGSIDNRSRITAWPTFNGSTNLQHQEQQLHHYQPSKNPYLDGSIFSTSNTSFSSLPQSSLNSHSPFPAVYASLHSDSPTTTAYCDQDVLLFSQQQQYSSFNPDISILNKENLCDMRLAPYLNNQLATSHSIVNMTHVDPAALVLSDSSRSSTPSTESGLSTPELNMSSSFTSTNDQDTLHPFLIDSFSRSLSLSPAAVVSSALSPSSSSSSSSTSGKSTPSPVSLVPAYYGIFMPDGTVYHFDGTSLVPAPMSRFPTTIEPNLLETMSLVDSTAVIQNSGCGYMQVPPPVMDFTQGTPSSLASSFGPGMVPQTAYMAPSLMTDYNTIFSNHPVECTQVPTLITGLRQDVSLTPSSPSSSSITSPLSSSTSSSSFKVSPLEILASLKPSAFKHSLPSSSSSCCSSPSSSTSRPKQPRPSRPATAKSSKRSTRHQRQKKDLRRSSTSSSSSSCSSSFSSFSSLQGSTPTTSTRATAIRTTRVAKPLSGPRPTAKFPCPFAGCDYRYNLKRELNRHKNIHLFEDKDKYQCLHCNAGLCRLDSVKRHMEAKGKSACLEYGLYREFKPNGEVKRIRECKDNWYAAAVTARMKGK
ncbi:hypothetical protein BG006_008491 [Podila minutissima]|uniref:C2H2-type domain-containing protein n=1 Tax=Podila minutissima TaxID=64525 RepID=A0A9P5VJX7_9FUNG|nr:hypothetical protein BG006_008491 [Podila minutissima]